MEKKQQRRSTNPAHALEADCWSIGSISAFLGLSHRTVARLIDNGDIKGWRINRERRTSSAYLAEYCQHIGRTDLVRQITERQPCALIRLVAVCGIHPEMESDLLRTLSPVCALILTPTLYHLGKISGAWCHVFGPLIDRSTLLEVIYYLAKEPGSPRLVAVIPEDEPPWKLRSAGCHFVLPWPCDGQTIAKAVLD